MAASIEDTKKFRRMKNKGMQLGAMLVAILLLSMAFVPTVSAKIEKAQIEKQLKDAATDDVKIDWIINVEERKEYKTTVVKAGKEQKFFVKQWKEEVDGKKVWKFKVFEISPDGVTASSVSFGDDSSYWTDTSGLHINFGPKDTGILEDNATGVIVVLAGIIAIKCPACTEYAALAAGVIYLVIINWVYAETNSDGSLDVFISWGNLALIPVYAVLTGNQNIHITIGSNNYPVSI